MFRMRVTRCSDRSSGFGSGARSDQPRRQGGRVGPAAGGAAALGVEMLEKRTLLSGAHRPSFIGLVEDPVDPAKTALRVVGTDNNDRIGFKAGATPGTVSVRFNGYDLGTFSPTGHLIAEGGLGDDKITVATTVLLPALLRGGQGSDFLKGGGGNDVLLGENGRDTLTGRGGRDLLIGGPSGDKLNGHDGDDIVVGGHTTLHDEALLAILAEWTSTRDYTTRSHNIHDGSGSTDRLNGSSFLNGATLSERPSGDKLKGGTERDLFFLHLTNDRSGDRMSDRQSDEIVMSVV